MLLKAKQFGATFPVPPYTVANLPSGQAIGSLAYATNGRAITGGVLASLSLQTAGQGTGCLVTWSGSAWQIAGTATTVLA